MREGNERDGERMRTRQRTSGSPAEKEFISGAAERTRNKTEFTIIGDYGVRLVTTMVATARH